MDGGRNYTKISLASGKEIHVDTYMAVWNKDFHLVGFSSGKAEEPLYQNKRSKKTAMGLGVTVTYAHSVGFVYFVI